MNTFIRWISVFSLLIPITLGIKNRKSLLWKYVLTGFFFDFTISLFKRVLNYKYIYIGNTYLLVEFILISMMYNKYVFKNNRVVYAFQIALIFYYFMTVVKEFTTVFSTYMGSIFLIVYIIYSLFGFHSILKSKMVLYLDKSMLFWINCGTIIYSSGNCFLFLFSNYLLKHDSSLFTNLWSWFFIGINIVTNLIWAKALRQQVDLQDE